MHRKGGNRRLLAALLGLSLLLGMLPLYLFSTSASPSGIEAAIVFQGETIETVTVPQNERVTVSASCTPAQKDAAYQWQILADGTSEQWVNIYDATEAELALSYGLLGSLLDASDSAYIRCRVTAGDKVAETAPVCATVTYTADWTPYSPSAAALALSAGENGTAVQSEGEYIDIEVRYLDAVSRRPIYTSYTGRIESGTAYTDIVVSPTYLGYAPFYNADAPAETDPDKATVSAVSVPLDIAADYAGSSYIINVYYKASLVPYAARYFFQNINDDMYTEDAGLYKVAHALTGTIVSDDDLIPNGGSPAGFSKLYHYPEAVAADGSTVFECYYDRTYYMIKFDMDGGYGTEPVYARYDTPFLVNQPTRHGYVFAGWDLLDKDGNGDGKADTLPATIPAKNRTYKAIWTTANTTYTVVYWLQNADDDNYSYVGAEKKTAQSGDPVSGGALLTAETLLCHTNEHTHVEACLADPTVNDGNYICGLEEHTHSADCRVESITGAPLSRYVYDHADQNVTVKGDGSTIVNVYYTRQYYTLRFIYAKEYNPEKDTVQLATGSIQYSIVGGSTHDFGNKSMTWPGDKYTLEDILYKVNDKAWGVVEGLPKLDNAKCNGVTYKLGTYPPEGDTTNDGYNKKGDKFYYFELTGRYGQDLTQLWPNDVFETIIVEKHSDNKADQVYEDGKWGKYAYLAGWNGEFKTTYSLDNSNSTVKGLYQKLDDTLLYGQRANGTDFTGTETSIKTTATPKTKDDTPEEVDSKAVYFLGFFENGANIQWSKPNEWTYELYVPVFKDEVESVDKTYITYNNQRYRLYDRIVTYDDNAVIYRNIHNSSSQGGWVAEIQQTQPTLSGFSFENLGVYTSEAQLRAVLNKRFYQPSGAKTGRDGMPAYTAQFFYERESFKLEMHSHNAVHLSDTVEFDSSLAKYANKVPQYPSTLEEGAYTFGGWYTSPECYPGSEFDFNTTMPASNLSLYAKWAPVNHSVRFFKTYDDMLAYQAGDTTVKPLETYEVPHGNVLENVQTPTNDPYTFTGWFFMDKGQMTAYTPLDMPVTRDLNVFADWGSLISQPYLIHYTLLDKESDQVWLTRLNEAASGDPEDNHDYTVTNGDETRTYVYLAQDGGYHREIADDTEGFAYQGNTRTFYPKAGDPYNQLYTKYNTGYFPTLASHSITIAAEDNKADPRNNVFTFTYVYAKDIAYRVEYRYRDTDELITSVADKGVKNATTSLAVVTERFEVIKDYIPDAFYKRLILAVEENENGEYVGSKDNVIVFYYTKNENNAYYAVHYMLQNVGAGTAFDTDKNGNYVNYTESDAHSEGIGAIGSEHRITPPAFSGFTVEDTAILNRKATNTVERDTTGNYFTITVEEKGTELYIFYTRNPQTYKVYHIRYGTEIQDLDALDALEYDETDAEHKNGVLQPIEKKSGIYGETVTAAAVPVNGMTCVSASPQSRVLRADDRQNYIIFYYAPLEYTVEYRVWSFGGGTLDRTIEVFDSNKISGSTATAKNGYRFDGWYLDAACTIAVADADGGSVDENGKLMPNVDKLNPAPQVNIFYAKFVPALGDLTITRRDAADEGAGDQVFVYKVTAKDDPADVIYVSITGNGSVTIRDLVCRDYTVEQVNGWSWRYADEPQDVTVAKGQTATADFGRKAAEDQWLNGNSAPVRNRKE